MDQNSLTENITKALGYTENGGKPDINHSKAGKTGEMKSIFQFEPKTWDHYSQQVFGKKVPLTADNETYVAHQKVSDWVKEDQAKGVPADQIPLRVASRWNAGPGEPDAYTGKFSDGSPSKGVNKQYGVSFSVPDYAEKFKKYFDEFSGQPSEVAMNEPTQPVQAPTAPAPAPQTGGGLLGKWKPTLQQKGQLLPIPGGPTS